MKLTAYQALKGLTDAAITEKDPDVKKVIEVAIKILKSRNE